MPLCPLERALRNLLQMVQFLYVKDSGTECV
jgi:hypothetical protein